MAVMAVSFAGLCFILLPVAGLIWLWLSVFRRSAVTDDLARCGPCDYAVRGIGSLTCPECGADLREVGIVTPKPRRVIGPVLFTLLWSALLLFPVSLISRIVTSNAPPFISGTSSTVLTPNSGLSGKVKLSFSYKSDNTLAAHGSSTSTRRTGSGTTSTLTFNGINPSQLDIIVLELVGLGNMSIVPSTLTCKYNVTASPKPRTWSAFNVAQMLAWYKACGLDVSKPEMITDATELVAIVTSLSKGNSRLTSQRFVFGGTSSSTRTTRTPNSYGLMILLAGAVVWIIGMIFYFKRRAAVQPDARTR